MKTKLLRKVRKDFEIRRNELGEERLFERFLFFGFSKYEGAMSESMALTFDERLNGKITSKRDLLIRILRHRYSKYCVKNKITEKRRNNWIKIWYNANT